MSAAATLVQPAHMGNDNLVQVDSSALMHSRDAAPSSSNLPPLQPLLKKSVLRTRALFASSDPLSWSAIPSNVSVPSAFGTADCAKARLASKIESEYRDLTQLPSALAAQQSASRPSQGGVHGSAGPAASTGTKRKLIEGSAVASSTAAAAALDEVASSKALVRQQHAAQTQPTLLSQSLIKRKEARSIKPDYHAQWKLSKVISGHLGWVRSACVEPGNQWFATGAGDRLIKIWDLATGELKLSLTGHISTVRGLAVSPRHPYLFSAGEDKMVKCWDLEQNKVIRHYHGHLSAVYTLALHPTLDVLVTGGRDSAVRVWDMRTKQAVHIMTGHTGTIADVKCQESDPQVISGSMDTTIRLWDLAAGKTMTQLTHHHKSVRSLAIHPTEFSFASGSAGSSNLKKWKFPEGAFVFNFQGLDNTIVNTVSVNDSGVFFAGADDGAMTWFDYRTGIPFQTTVDKPQPGSLDAEAGIFVSTFDQTGSRLITAGCDKTIKIWAEQ